VNETEATFQARIKALAERYGWQVWHVPAPMRWDPTNKAWVPAREGAGLPDLILLHDDPPRLVFLELKRKGGKLTDRQQEFLQAAKRVADVSIMWPHSVNALAAERIVGVFAAWPDDETRIEQMLRSKVVS
jgi:VRR-NUC domain